MCQSQSSQVKASWQTFAFTPQHPWTHLTMDFLTDLPESQGQSTILVVCYCFFHFLHLLPLPTLPRAFTTAELLFNHILRNFGLPEDIVSDRGVQFTSHVWKAFMDKLGITMSLTSGYHPQANSQVNQANQEIGTFCHTSCSDNQEDWSCFLPRAEYVQNTL